ncbi:MAG TPA: RluA family pseudouridine synthase [Vicinamibacterales bacterium]|nr:RluA family pseudouridine synthase [Vicinamibacterales bacterium]
MSDPQRLDRRLRDQQPELSWARIRQAIERGQVVVDGAIARDPGSMIAAAAAVDFDPSRRALPNARLDLPRLYEDDEILVIDKPAGLLTIATDPEFRAIEDTVLRRIQAYARFLHGPRSYAGVLHRLDRGTSGALATALSREAHHAGRALFAEHSFDRWYLAIVHGMPERESGTIEGNISNEYSAGRRRIVRSEEEGRPAVTHYTVRETFPGAALLELRLETGRQHQIRLHLERLGHPIIGEHIYVGAGEAGRAGGAGRAGRAGGAGGGAGRAGSRARVAESPRPLLHAWRLEFPHPLRRITVHAEAPVPPDFLKALRRLQSTPRR